MIDELISFDPEEYLLSIVTQSKSSLKKAMRDLTLEHFQKQKHKDYFQVVKSMYDDGIDVDVVTIYDYASKRSQWDLKPSDITNIATSSPTTANYETYVRLVIEGMIKRKLTTLNLNLHNRITNSSDSLDVYGWLETELRKIHPKNFIKWSSSSNVEDDIRSFVQDVLEQKKETPVIKTGYSEIDDNIYGFFRGDYVVIGGRTSMGKTAFALNVIANNQIDKCKVLYVSIEMSRKQILSRLLAMVSYTDIFKITRGFVNSSEDKKSIVDALQIIQNWSISVDDSGSQNVMKVRSKAEELKENGLDVIVVDHIGLIDFDNKKSRYEGLTGLSKQMKALAKELDVVVIVLCQLNREAVGRADKTPNLGDIRDSGAIEQDADCVILLHSDDYYNEEKKSNKEYESKVIVAKDRNNGGLGTYNLRFLRNIQKFKETKIF